MLIYPTASTTHGNKRTKVKKMMRSPECLIKTYILSFSHRLHLTEWSRHTNRGVNCNVISEADLPVPTWIRQQFVEEWVAAAEWSHWGVRASLIKTFTKGKSDSENCAHRRLIHCYWMKPLIYRDWYSSLCSAGQCNCSDLTNSLIIGHYSVYLWSHCIFGHFWPFLIFDQWSWLITNQ